MSMKANWLFVPMIGLGLQIATASAMAQDAPPDQALGASQQRTADAASPAQNGGMNGEAGKAWFNTEWDAYKASFLLPDGRIVDNANGRVSHSEGQGYGLLLAALAHDAASFETIWRWTEKHLMIRPDGLAAWKWDPQTEAVADSNNASDGDILIAWALAKAARRFGRPDYRDAARSIAQAVGAFLIKPSPRGPILMPGISGFGSSAQPDGPLVNPSYYVFPAFDDLKDLAPEHDWDGLRETGLAIIEASRFGPLNLPTEWEAVGHEADVAPARNFPSTFGYNAIRIPLYLAWGTPPGAQDLGRFAQLWDDGSESTAHITPVKAGPPPPIFYDAGYKVIIGLARCLATGRTIPQSVYEKRDTLYYAATLRLLAIAAAQERFPQCL